MAQTERPLRSVLYIPASKARALDKARSLPVDAIIFDLEDAVAPEEKVAARELLASTLAEGGYGPRLRLVRINGLDTPWGAEDARAAAEMSADAILLPKVNAAADLAPVAALAPGRPLWAMIETARGVLNARDIADAPEMAGFVLGTNDLAKELGARVGPGRPELTAALQVTLLAARAAEIPCIDGVYNAYKDTEGLAAECMAGRNMGMDGKTLIHPAQIATANEIFAPDAAAVAMARRQIAAFETALEKGEGVAVLDGRIVENLHVETARATLAKAEAIAAQTEGNGT